MQLLVLLGSHLKDAEVVRLLEWAGMAVIYSFDRHGEKQPDEYWAASNEKGFQLGFDADQVLFKIFLYAAPIEGFTPITNHDCDVPFFATVGDVESYAVQNRIISKRGGPTKFLGILREWVRLEYEKYSLHYEFRAEGLALVTVTLKRS